MLPEAWVKAASLDEGRLVPCVSLYVTVSDDAKVIYGTETRLERIAVKTNLRYDTFEPEITDEMMINHALTIPHARAVEFLWHFARARLAEREEVRGKPEILGRIEWSFVLDGEEDKAHVTLKPRKRGAPIDLLVAELMIFANSTWGLWLEEHGYAGIYRSQRMGRVKMSTGAARRARCGALFLGNLSAAPLCRHGQSASDYCGRAGRRPRVSG